MSRSPLDHPRLAVIDRKLDSGELDEAQHLLAQLGDNYFFRHATTYLASRLLYLRGTLDEESLIERLVRVLNETHDFPEAEALLAQAKAGTLVKQAPVPRSSRPPPASLGSQPPGPEIEIAFGSRHLPERPRLGTPEIPRAGRLPDVAHEAKAARPGSIPDLEIAGAPPPGFAAEAAPARRTPARPAAPPAGPREESLQLTERAPVRARDSEPIAGARYSSTPSASEAVSLRKKSTGPGRPAGSSSPAARRQYTEPIIGTEPPAPAERASLFEVAGLLDAGRADEALNVLATRGDPAEPDHALLKARALARAGRGAEAVEVARRLGAAPLLEPTIRAGVARLALELGEVDFGLEQAARAHEEDPIQPTIRLTYAWAALRRARRSADPELVSYASLALRELVGDGGPHEGLLLGLRACVEAHSGDALRALRLAERAIALEPSADAYAALAMAAARLGRPDDVKRASALLRDKSPAEAAALGASLEAHGEELFELVTKPESIYAPAASPDTEASSLWGPLEMAVVQGHWRQAFETFAQLGADTLSQVSAATRHEPPALAAVAASFLTVAPISRDLAPFDQTPWSLLRIADLFALLSRGAAEVAIDHPLATLIGAYVGESLRLCYRARWSGTLDDPASREVTGEQGAFRPFALVLAALAGRGDLSAAASRAEAVASDKTVLPHLPAVTPLCPWDPAQWPAPSRLPHYAVALERSVISVLCAERTGSGLDGSMASLNALDEHVERIAPKRAPLHADTRWARRATVLLGAYLGEVLRRETGADWSKPDSLELGPTSYRLVLPSGREAWPMEHVFARLTAGAVSLHEYALRIDR